MMTKVEDKTYTYHVEAKTSEGQRLEVIICTPTKIDPKFAITLGKRELLNDLTWSVSNKTKTALDGTLASHFILDDPWETSHKF